MEAPTGLDVPRGWPESGAEQFVQAQTVESQPVFDLLAYVRSNPGKTVLVSAAIGIVLGRLLRRL